MIVADVLSHIATAFDSILNVFQGTLAEPLEREHTVRECTNETL